MRGTPCAAQPAARCCKRTGGDIVLRYIDALRNPEPTRAALACTMLAQLGDRRAIPPLLELVESRPRAFEILTAAVESLAAFRTAAAIPILTALLHDPEAVLPARVAALRALVGYGGKTAEEATTWARRSTRPALRATAKEASHKEPMR
jgi:HEAT repeat protein